MDSVFKSDLPSIKVEARVNISDEIVVEQVRQNVRRQLPQAMPYAEQDSELILACGGPSLESEFSRLRDLREEGAKLVSMNGTHDWLLERGLKPSAFVMIDGRPENVKFVRNPQRETKYYIASQCHPSVLDALEGYDVYLFHSILSLDKEGAHAEAIREYYFGRAMPVTGASTVATRAMVLFSLMGFRYFHVFGFDSCWLTGKHHAYTQVENDADPSIPVWCGGKWWECSPFHIAQADEFQQMVRVLGDRFEMQIYGEGLIAHMVNTCAELDLSALSADRGKQDGSSAVESLQQL